jgi:uncharacterized membrane protein
MNPEKMELTAMLRRWVIAGLLIWIPLGVTLLVIRSMIGVLDSLLLPSFISTRIPGLGVLLTIAVVLGTGAVASNYAGSRALGWVESALGRIPLVRSIYGSMKKLAQTIFSGSSTSFRQPVLLEYPRKGLWTVAFITGEPPPEVRTKTSLDLITCFVPTTPNPTSGFILLVPETELIRLDLSVEEAMKYVISLGMVTPDEVARRALPPPEAPASK